MGAYREMWKLINKIILSINGLYWHINDLEGGKLLNILKVLIHSRGFLYTFWLGAMGGKSFKTFLLVDIASSDHQKYGIQIFTSDAIRREDFISTVMA